MRRLIASASVLNESACSARPGIGSVRGTAPSASTSSRHATVCGPSAVTTAAVCASRSRAVTLPRIRSACGHICAQRHDAMPRLERPRRGFGQKRRVEHEVLLADDRRPALAELAGDVGAGEAPADDEHPAARFSDFAHWPSIAQRGDPGFGNRQRDGARGERRAGRPAARRARRDRRHRRARRGDGRGRARRQERRRNDRSASSPARDAEARTSGSTTSSSPASAMRATSRSSRPATR